MEIGGEPGAGTGGGPDINELAERARGAFTAPGTGEPESVPAGRTRGPLLRNLPPPPTEAQPRQPAGEIILGRMERAKIFGRSALNFLTADSKRTRIAEFAAGAATSAVTKTIARELVTNILGSAATGFVGRMAIGGAAGAIVGAAKEWIKQVRSPIPQAELSVEETAELANRRGRFLERLKRLKPTDKGAIGKSALRGAFFGAIGAGVATVVMDLWEAGQLPGIQGIKEAAGAAGRTAGDVLSGDRDLAGHIPNSEYPDLGGIPQVTAEVAEGAGQATHEAIAQAPESLSAQDASSLATDTAKAAKEQALGALTSNHEFLERTAAAVGEQIDQSNLAVDEVIRAAGMDPTQLSGEAYEKIRMSVQHKMEALANEAFHQAASSADNLDPSHITEIAKQGHDEFVASLANPDTQQHLLKSASEALKDHLMVQQEIVENLSQVLHSSPDLTTEVMTAHGDTVGQMLVDHGYNITWGAADAEVLGAHIAANYNQLSNMWGAMAQVDNLPAGVHFPVSLTDLPNLIKQAQSGDAGALQKLKDALHWIPAGKKFTILNAKQLTKILAALSKT